jgi:hypothetical protein
MSVVLVKIKCLTIEGRKCSHNLVGCQQAWEDSVHGSWLATVLFHYKFTRITPLLLQYIQTSTVENPRVHRDEILFASESDLTQISLVYTSYIWLIERNSCYEWCYTVGQTPTFRLVQKDNNGSIPHSVPLTSPGRGRVTNHYSN